MWYGITNYEIINRHLTNLKEIFVLHENRYLYGSSELIQDLMNIDAIKNGTLEKIIFDLDRPTDEIVLRKNKDAYTNVCSYYDEWSSSSCLRTNQMALQHKHNSLSELYSCGGNHYNISAGCYITPNISISFWKKNIDKIYYCKARVPENRFPVESELIKYTESDYFLPLI